MAESWWSRVDDQTLRQGDYFPRCLVPVIPRELGESDHLERPVGLLEYGLIILTQSCDLENQRAKVVASCPIWPVSDFERVSGDPSGSRRQWASKWNSVRKGREPALHLLPSPTDPLNAESTLVVDFRQIHSLPFEYLTRRASELAERWRLMSPYLEHFSQAFARFFMRVGLPSSVPEFK